MRGMRLRPLPALFLALLAFGAGLACDSGEDGEAGARTAATAEPARTTSGERPTPGAAQRVRGVRLRRVGTFAEPTYITAPPGDRRRRYVVERSGRIRVIRGRRILRRPLLDISGRVMTGGESGMLSMAFAPDFARSRHYYVYFTDNAGHLRIEQFRTQRSNPERTARGSNRVVIREPHFRFNHKGGQVQFGPDGMLYTGFGDGGGSGDPDRAAQSLGTLKGKLLRIDPRPNGGYDVPRDNPFVGRAGARPAIYAYGLRNPYRFSFDRATGDLSVGDVGQNAVEEIDFVPNRRGRGRAPFGGYNFGWSLFEGRSRFRAGDAPGHVPPVTQRTHSQGSCSITGGYVIRDPAFGRFRGTYVYGDLCDPRLRAARLRRGGAIRDRALGPRVSGLVSFGEDARGGVYAVSLRGPVYRLLPRR
jgi:glucose/arabinose dehydrogenase